MVSSPWYMESSYEWNCSLLINKTSSIYLLNWIEGHSKKFIPFMQKFLNRYRLTSIWIKSDNRRAQLVPLGIPIVYGKTWYYFLNEEAFVLHLMNVKSPYPRIYARSWYSWHNGSREVKTDRRKIEKIHLSFQLGSAKKKKKTTCLVFQKMLGSSPQPVSFIDILSLLFPDLSGHYLRVLVLDSPNKSYSICLKLQEPL
jgi:hypothetical protein